jgi:hypothetical protein
VTKLARSASTGGSGADPGTRQCRWCGRPFAVVPGPGRPRAYCRQSCRQRDYEARQRTAGAGLADGEIVVTRADLDELRDRLYALESAIEDAQRDLAATSRPSAADYQDALAWILDVHAHTSPKP